MCPYKLLFSAYAPLGTVTVKLEIETVPPETNVTPPEKFRSAPDVPTEPSAIASPLLSAILNHAAVPAPELVSSVILAAVDTPLAEAPNAVVLNVKVANNVLPLSAVAGFVGCVPV